MTVRRNDEHSVFEGLLEFVFDVVFEVVWWFFSEVICRAFGMVARWVCELIDF